MKALLLTTQDQIEDPLGNLTINLYRIVVAGGWTEGAIIALPNITMTTLKATRFKSALQKIADAESLDMVVIFPGTQGNKSERWELGWIDGPQIVVTVYTAEHYAVAKDMPGFLKMIGDELA